MRTRLISLGIALVAGLAACGPKPAPEAAAPPVVDTAAVYAGVADLWVRWSAADTAADAAAIADMVTDSVRLDMKGFPPVLGRASWHGILTEMYKMYKYDPLEMRPSMTVAVDNNLAYQIGTYSQGGWDAKKKHTKDYSRYAAAIQKGADGKWRISYWMGFTDSTVVIK
jgi:ketosteroid isomerase-like protein